MIIVPVKEGDIRRELYEETGLRLKRIKKILPPAFAAVSVTDIKNQIAFVEVEEDETVTNEHASVNEEIRGQFYGVEELKELLETREFTSRCQVIVYYFLLQHGAYPKNE